MYRAMQSSLKSHSTQRAVGMEGEETKDLLDTPLFVCALAFLSLPTNLPACEPRCWLVIRGI